MSPANIYDIQINATTRLLVAADEDKWHQTNAIKKKKRNNPRVLPRLDQLFPLCFATPECIGPLLFVRHSLFHHPSLTPPFYVVSARLSVYLQNCSSLCMILWWESWSIHCTRRLKMGDILARVWDVWWCVVSSQGRSYSLCDTECCYVCTLFVWRMVRTPWSLAVEGSSGGR